MDEERFIRCVRDALMAEGFRGDEFLFVNEALKDCLLVYGVRSAMLWEKLFLLKTLGVRRLRRIDECAEHEFKNDVSGLKECPGCDWRDCLHVNDVEEFFMTMQVLDVWDEDSMDEFKLYVARRRAKMDAQDVSDCGFAFIISNKVLTFCRRWRWGRSYLVVVLLKWRIGLIIV